MTKKPNELQTSIESAADAFSNALAATQIAIEKADQNAKDGRQVALDLLLIEGLYSHIDASTAVGIKAEADLRDGSSLVFDTYCIGCRDRSTFRVQVGNVAQRSIISRPGQTIIPPGVFATHAVCQRKHHVYSYIFKKEGGQIIKIGQSPSMADISFGELRSIDKSLDPIDRRELGKALGLFAHNTALGAYVYLRRVFERMIVRAHERQSAAGHPIEGFATMRMDDRISALAEELPQEVVENSAIFSVLSIGIHELTEEQCAKHFPVMKAVLFQMLEAEEHKRKAALAAKATKAALQTILADPKA